MQQDFNNLEVGDIVILTADLNTDGVLSNSFKKGTIVRIIYINTTDRKLGYSNFENDETIYDDSVSCKLINKGDKCTYDVLTDENGTRRITKSKNEDTEVIDYKSMKNFIHNELKISKRDMYEFMDSIIRQEVHGRIESLDLNDMILNHVRTTMKEAIFVENMDNLFIPTMNQQITKAITDEILKKYNINITKTEDEK